MTFDLNDSTCGALLEISKSNQARGSGVDYIEPEMAKSMFEYVKKFERVDICLPSVWLICRIDGCSFHRYVF